MTGKGKGQENVKAIVVGAAGKMGGRIIHIIKETPSIEVYQAIERPDHPSIGKDIGEIIGLGKMGIPLEKELKKAQEISPAVAHVDFGWRKIEAQEPKQSSGCPHRDQSAEREIGIAHKP